MWRMGQEDGSKSESAAMNWRGRVFSIVCGGKGRIPAKELALDAAGRAANDRARGKEGSGAKS